MRRVLVVLLTLAALLVGFFLPTVVSSLQDRSGVRWEDAAIQEVNLSLSSGLSIAEKLQMFSDETSTQLTVGLGKVQTVETLAASSWVVLNRLVSYGVQLLVPETTVQEEQAAILISNGDQAFIAWQILFDDGDNNTCWLYLDDETGLPLSVSYYAGTDIGLSASLLLSSMEAMLAECGMWRTYEESIEPENEETAAVPEKMDGYYLDTQVTVTDGTAQLRLPLMAGDGWFIANPLRAG